MLTSEKQSQQVFNGSSHEPFLAPRGVHYSHHGLLVADTGRNRVLFWSSVQKASFQEPDLILGNQEKEVSASSMHYPSGVWTNGIQLAVADAWNHRVLLWLNFPVRNFQPADVIIGQPDEYSSLPNGKGINQHPGPETLYWPYGVWSNGNHLCIADTGNRRALLFNDFPASNFSPAHAVCGQPDFFSRDYDSSNAIWPYSVKIGPNDELAVTDTAYYRVLLWQDYTRAFAGQPADTIIGQVDFSASGQNQNRMKPDSHTLSWCYDTAFHNRGIWVADTGNSRILYWPELPKMSNAKASELIGQPDFTTGSENPDSVRNSRGYLYWPFSVSIYEGCLALADTGNHRIVFTRIS